MTTSNFSRRYCKLILIFTLVFIIDISWNYWPLFDDLDSKTILTPTTTTKTQQVSPSKFKTILLGEFSNSNTSSTSPITIVTTLFRFNKAKHTKEDYLKWAHTMLESLGSPFIAFVDPISAKFFQQYFTSNNSKININGVLIVAEDIWQVMTELEIERNRSYRIEYENRQIELDPESLLHSPELYAVWNLKTYMVRRVVEANPFRSEIFIYVDSGSWRGEPNRFRNWPNVEFTRKIAAKIKNRILFAQVGELVIGVNATRDLVQGGFFAATSKSIFSLYKEFYDLHDSWIDQGRFVGKDQNMMNHMTFESLRNRIVRLKAYGLECSVEIDKWFFFQYYFSNQNEYVCNHDRFSLLLFEK